MFYCFIDVFIYMHTSRTLTRLYNSEYNFKNMEGVTLLLHFENSRHKYIGPGQYIVTDDSDTVGSEIWRVGSHSGPVDISDWQQHSLS